VVYRETGYFSIILYINGGNGGRSPALPSVSLGVSQEKKDLPTNIALEYSWGFFGYRLVEL